MDDAYAQAREEADRRREHFEEWMRRRGEEIAERLTRELDLPEGRRVAFEEDQLTSHP